MATMNLIPDDDAYNYHYLEIEHNAGYKQLYELSDRISVDLVQDAARQLKIRYVEAWALLMRGESLTLWNTVFRLIR
jgi:hypothetical protein